MGRNSGFDDLGKQLKKMERNIKDYENGKEVGFNELFNESFMRKYTDFGNIDNFFEESPFTVETNEDLENIDDSKLDAYVSQTTRFSTWEAMLNEAGKIHLTKKLGF
ncbi:hypothetical protein JOC86_002376 [Bacillus pakistanensis]|uniref:Uncharacterized protein n=1 Tax=Rossellomorea pakistanensis TaxID=992288 RepID=A0ABS2NDE2_9BACI|nr:hypothetical protein [Bacillus pakistanensis]MBM7585834.1 hypothetical protein [Bacillus pakistanensis]